MIESVEIQGTLVNIQGTFSALSMNVQCTLVATFSVAKEQISMLEPATEKKRKPPIGQTARIFSVPVLPLATRREYSQSLSSHWPVAIRARARQ
jgi:hypothetical protein